MTLAGPGLYRVRRTAAAVDARSGCRGWSTVSPWWTTCIAQCVVRSRRCVGTRHTGRSVDGSDAAGEFTALTPNFHSQRYVSRRPRQRATLTGARPATAVRRTDALDAQEVTQRARRPESRRVGWSVVNLPAATERTDWGRQADTDGCQCSVLTLTPPARLLPAHRSIDDEHTTGHDTDDKMTTFSQQRTIVHVHTSTVLVHSSLMSVHYSVL